MQIKSVEFDEKSNLNNIEVDLNNEEVKWFIGFAFNVLFKAGLFACTEGTYTPTADLQKALKGKDA